MAIKPEEQYPGKIEPSTPDYPYGSARNTTVPGDGTGTPWEAALVNDQLGFQQALLAAGEVVPSGNPEKATASQYLQSLFKTSGLVRESYAALRLFDSASSINTTSCFISGAGVAGFFTLDKSDTVTVDDGAITIVDANGGRWKREWTGAAFVGWWGAVGDGVADDTASIVAALAYITTKRLYLDLRNGRFRITEQVAFNEVWILSDGAVILKDFDGTGILVTGGSYYFRLRGDLRVEGTGAGLADGLSETTNGNANGVVVQGCRLDIDGKFESTNHQGNGFFINCNGNMNRSIVQQLHAWSNNVRGIRFTGTQDDCAVWQISTYTFGNYEGGVLVDDDFQGRQWDWYCYNEGSNNPAGLYGVYLGRIRACKNITVYSEEQTLNGLELQISANCENLVVFDMRVNRSNNDSVETCSLVAGSGGLWSQNSISYERPSRSVVLTDAGDRFIGKQTYGSSSALLMEERIYGTSAFERQLSARTNSVDMDFGQGASLGESFHHYGAGHPQQATFSYDGTRSAPLDTTIGDVFSERHYAQPNGVLRELTRVDHKLDAVAANRGVASITWATVNNDFTPVVKMTLQADGALNVPAGYLPFTGLHIGRSTEAIATGLAVDVESVLRDNVEAEQKLPEKRPVPSEDGEDQDAAIAYNDMVDEMAANWEPLIYERSVPVVSVTQVAKSKVCMGVVDRCVERDDGQFDVYIAAVGDNSTVDLVGFLVTDENGSIEAGDILCTAGEPGHLMLMPDGESESVQRFKAMETAEFVDGKAVIYGYFK